MSYSRDWEDSEVLLSVIVRNNYRTVLARHARFQDVIQAIGDYMGMSVGKEMLPFIILSVEYLSQEDADFLEEADMYQVLVNG